MPESKQPKLAPEESVLKQLVNAPDVVTAFGKSYEIKRFNLGQIAQAVDYAPYVGALLVKAMGLSKNPTPDEMVNFVTQGLTVAGPVLIPILSIATREPIEWLEEQDDVVAAMELFAKVVEKNRSFFTQENRERLQRAFSNLLPSGGNAPTTS